MNWNLDQLHLFVRTAECRSFSAVARESGRAQSAVSTAIALLETDLGDGRWLPIDGSPVEFVFPGEKGFLARQPIHDCDALTAEAARPLILPASLKE